MFLKPPKVLNPYGSGYMEAWRCAAETLLRLAGGMTARQGEPPHLTPGPSLGATAGWRYGTRLDLEEDRAGEGHGGGFLRPHERLQGMGAGAHRQEGATVEETGEAQAAESAAEDGGQVEGVECAATCAKDGQRPR